MDDENKDIKPTKIKVNAMLTSEPDEMGTYNGVVTVTDGLMVLSYHAPEEDNTTYVYSGKEIGCGHWELQPHDGSWLETIYLASSDRFFFHGCFKSSTYKNEGVLNFFLDSADE